MFTYTISAALNYADYGLLGLAGLLFLTYLFKGFSKSLYGFFFSIMLLLVAVLITGYAADPLIRSQYGQQFYSSVQAWSNSWGLAFNGEIVFNNGVPYVIGNGGAPVELYTLLGGNPAVKLAVEKLVPLIIPAEGGLSLADVLVPNLVYIATHLALFIVSFLALKIVFRFIEFLWDKLTLNGKRYKFLDKLVGAIISLVYTGAFACFVLAALTLLSAKFAQLSGALDLVNSSALLSWLNAFNPVTQTLARFFVAA
jgi:hypothetical protein